MAPLWDMSGRVVAITGGSGGMGFATAQLLLSQGAKVSISDVNQEQLKAAEEKLRANIDHGDLMTTVVDVRNPSQVDEWIVKTTEKWGKLDGAVNLAGVIPKSIHTAGVEDISDADWKFVMDINLTGVFHSMRSEIKHMNKGGSIINASSVAGLMGFKNNGAYTASKVHRPFSHHQGLTDKGQHAIIGLSRSAAKEVGDRNIRVNCICPGVIDTPMQRESTEIRGGEMAPTWPIARNGKPEEIAQLCLWLLCDASSYITGTVQAVDGGFTC